MMTRTCVIGCTTCLSGDPHRSTLTTTTRTLTTASRVSATSTTRIAQDLTTVTTDEVTSVIRDRTTMVYHLGIVFSTTGNHRPDAKRSITIMVREVSGIVTVTRGDHARRNRNQNQRRKWWLLELYWSHLEERADLIG